MWGLPLSRWKQLVKNRRNAWEQVSFWVILLHLHIDRSEFNSFLGTDYKCLLAIFCLICLKYSIVSAAPGRMMFHLHLPNLFFLIYLVPNEHNRRANVCRSTLTCSPFHSWLGFVNSIYTEKQSDETIAGAVTTDIQNSCSLFSWVHNWSRFLSCFIT